MRKLGFVVSYSDHAFAVSGDGIYAGSIEERAADLMDAFTDPSVDAIIASHATKGTRDIISMLDAQTTAANPKAFLGYSENISS
jgi:muramoyltetrapeptide carboxypeptidase